MGDAYGAPFEFMGHRECHESIGKAEPRFRSGGVHNVEAGEWTDDTAMARCISDSYIKHQEIDERHIMINFHNWIQRGSFGTRDYCFDVGGSCSRSISDWILNRERTQAEHDERLGNGGIMRLAPVVTFNAENYYHAVNDAVQTSQFTHRNATCDFYAEAVMDIIFDTGLFNLDDLPDIKAGSGHVQDTFFTALISFEKSDTFLDSIHFAASCGGDTDTTAAVAGMFAGAYYGASQIPAELTDGLIDSDILHQEAEFLYQMGKAKRGAKEDEIKK